MSFQMSPGNTPDGRYGREQDVEPGAFGRHENFVAGEVDTGSLIPRMLFEYGWSQLGGYAAKGVADLEASLPDLPAPDIGTDSSFDWWRDDYLDDGRHADEYWPECPHGVDLDFRCDDCEPPYDSWDYYEDPVCDHNVLLGLECQECDWDRVRRLPCGHYALWSDDHNCGRLPEVYDDDQPDYELDTDIERLEEYLSSLPEWITTSDTRPGWVRRQARERFAEYHRAAHRRKRDRRYKRRKYRARELYALRHGHRPEQPGAKARKPHQQPSHSPWRDNYSLPVSQLRDKAALAADRRMDDAYEGDNPYGWWTDGSIPEDHAEYRSADRDAAWTELQSRYGGPVFYDGYSGVPSTALGRRYAS